MLKSLTWFFTLWGFCLLGVSFKNLGAGETQFMALFWCQWRCNGSAEFASLVLIFSSMYTYSEISLHKLGKKKNQKVLVSEKEWKKLAFQEVLCSSAQNTLVCSYTQQTPLFLTPVLLQLQLPPLFSSYLGFFLLIMAHSLSHKFSCYLKYLASSSPKHFLFYSECPRSQFGHKPSETSHLNSGIQILAINFTLNELTQTCN